MLARRPDSSYHALSTSRRLGRSGHGARVMRLSAEVLELRYLLSVSPLHFGVVYVEQDDGVDQRGDTFEVSFTGGAPGTVMTHLEINTDQTVPGFSVGDVFFDTVSTGLGAEESHVWQLDTITGSIVVTQHAVDDGGMLLTMDFSGFHADDKLTFIVDVDEVEDLTTGETDVAVINDGLDPITSGVEFQGSNMQATFSAPHYHDVTESARFFNRYDERLVDTGLSLSPDNVDNKRDLTAGAIGKATQTPLPISIAGTVWDDRDADLVREATESGIAAVVLDLYRQSAEGTYEPTGHSTQTDAQGHYQFDVSLELPPGVYQIRENQPAGYFSVGAVVGTIDGAPNGAWNHTTPDILSDLELLDGGLSAVNYDFAEARPSSLAGRVHLSTPDGDCFSATEVHEPVVGATILLRDQAGQTIAETTTDASGGYQFQDLRPGMYTLIEITPQGLIDGGVQVGIVDGQTRGESGESLIREIELFSGDVGTDYEFCEQLPATLSGYAYHDRDNDGVREAGEEPIEQVELRLFDDTGNQVASTMTDDMGRYLFAELLAGTYRIVETQPTGWLDGIDTVGTIGGLPVGQATNSGDAISEVRLRWGDDAIDYNFGELRVTSIAGRVHYSTPDGDCFGAQAVNAQPIVGATVQLLDADMQIVQQTTTDAQGHYRFSELLPGEYSIREITPDGLFEGGAQAGQVESQIRGEVDAVGDITHIVLGSGDEGVDYDFCDLQPAEISGTVYHDRNDDGRKTAAEVGLPGVTLMLVNEQGESVATQITAADGSYHFRQLPAGVYRVQEVQPDGWLDGQDRAGRVDGVPVGLAAEPGDSIAAIALGWGSVGVDYNFGELLAVSLQGRVHFSTPDGDCFGPLAELTDPLAGATVFLLDAQGSVVAQTMTDASGEYEFADLRPGTYGVREVTPQDLIDGGAQAGDVDGEPRGAVDQFGDIVRVELLSGEHGKRYDFCDLRPARLSGYVYHDRNNDGVRGRDELPLPKTLVILYDQHGQEVASAETDAQGRYEFQKLSGGRYELAEIQPVGYLDGRDTAGQVDGQFVGQADQTGDRIRGVDLLWGSEGVEFNFGELLPGSIRGFVHSSPDSNCWEDQDAEPLADVLLELLDEQGQVVARTHTDTTGSYLFANLAPGRYSIREEQPLSVFQGNEHAGSGGGEVVTPNLITDIEISSGKDLQDYAYCELPPAALSGFVFRDGDAITLGPEEQLPTDLSLIRDGTLTSDDQPLAGVTLELRDGLSGLPISHSDALPGAYPTGPIHTTSDATGAYHFGGLPSGNYAVYEIHPDGYLDGLETPGTTDGIPVNPQVPMQWTPAIVAFVSALTVDPQNDAILGIRLAAGVHSQLNNFSELQTIVVTPPPSLPPLPELPVAPTPMQPIPGPETQPLLVARHLPVTLQTITPKFDVVNGEIRAHTWHLSVIDGGQPRAPMIATTNVSTVDSFVNKSLTWQPSQLNEGRWLIERNVQGQRVELRFGAKHAIPIAGDFNGDGTSEAGLFVDGEWFIDLNGNGRWDEGDLWAKLGQRDDLPVTGDWDGDGKDDIGTFGRAWPGDPKALSREPGLPDLDNRTIGETKNVPPAPQDASLGRRSLKRTATGPVRTDVIDHVLFYGMGGDKAVSGDWNGDGIDTVGIFRDGHWRLDVDGNGEATDADHAFEFGRAGDIPIVGDFNGDGVDEVGVVRDGQIILDSNRNRTFDAGDRVIRLPATDGSPVVGDFDSDGLDEVVFYVEGNG